MNIYIYKNKYKAVVWRTSILLLSEIKRYAGWLAPKSMGFFEGFPSLNQGIVCLCQINSHKTRKPLYRTAQTNTQQSESLCGTFAASVVSELTQLTDGQRWFKHPSDWFSGFPLLQKAFDKKKYRHHPYYISVSFQHLKCKMHEFEETWIWVKKFCKKQHTSPSQTKGFQHMRERCKPFLSRLGPTNLSLPTPQLIVWSYLLGLFCWRSCKIQHHLRFFFAWGSGATFKHVGSFQPFGVPNKKGNVSEMVEWGEWKNLADSTTYSYSPEKVTQDKLAMSVFFEVYWIYSHMWSKITLNISKEMVFCQLPLSPVCRQAFDDSIKSRFLVRTCMWSSENPEKSSS